MVKLRNALQPEDVCFFLGNGHQLSADRAAALRGVPSRGHGQGQDGRPRYTGFRVLQLGKVHLCYKC